jgi:hypothetical protein
LTRVPVTFKAGGTVLVNSVARLVNPKPSRADAAAANALPRTRKNAMRFVMENPLFVFEGGDAIAFWG